MDDIFHFDTLLAGPPDQLLKAQEQERQRIAADLHDALGPLLTLIRLELGRASELVREDDLSDLAVVIGRAHGHVAQAFDELRRTVVNLRPAMLDDLGILPTLGWLVREFERCGSGLRIRTDFAVTEQAVPSHLKITIFRICQEALNNIVRHAQASHAALSLTLTDESLCLAIDDDGCGMPDNSHRGRGPAGGTSSIPQRATSSGGRCDITSGPGLGTRIHVCWPLAGIRP
ncbi:sensor histidine kinase [Massilia horti]|uniref:histidine kinase n=1 Tax=Massilia horti TaxID=2562153 RepID=A0A4Y9T0L4_9BURK|nr:sensor histidine kinase [Massilia horti]TFW32319.1 sensor histidine kinase [Massilia horti]